MPGSRRHEQLQYLSQSVALEESFSPHLVRSTMLAISAAVLAFVVWAALAHVDELARATGEIVPLGYVQAVQHLEGGIVKSILVAERQPVRKGDILMELSGIGTEQDLAEAQARQKYMEEQNAKLQSLLAGDTAADAPSPELAALVERRAAIRNNIASARKELDVKKKMAERGSASLMQIMEVEQRLNTLQGDLAALNDEFYRQQGVLHSEMEQNAHRIIKLQDRVDRLTVRAPVGGLVKGLRVNTIGAVIKSGETLLEIVPDSETLVADIHIEPRDAGNLKPGQTVRVKVSSYDFSRYGALEGTLDMVSANTFADASGRKYYRGRVTLSRQYVGSDPLQNAVIPGMTVEADIITGRKTILGYLLKPVQTALHNSLTEK